MTSTTLSRAEPLVRRGVRPVLWLAVLAPAAYLITALLTDQLGANPIEELERESGRWALRLLAASLTVTPLMRLTGWGWLVPQRRFLGLATFFYALSHLSVYMVLDWFFDWDEILKDVVEHWYITAGLLAVTLMIPLALTSTKRSIRWLGGKRWTTLHRLVYVSAVAGSVHFYFAVKKDVTQPIIYAVLFAALLAFRIVWKRRAAKTRPAPADSRKPRDPVNTPVA